MHKLNTFEQKAIEFILAGQYPVFKSLQSQYQEAEIVNKKYTGVGFFIEFQPPQKHQVKVNRIDDVYAKSGDSILGFILYIKDGYIDTLEGYTYDLKWPEDLSTYELYYSDPERGKYSQK